MKKLICLLVFLSLTTGVQAGDKKKKKPDASSAPASAAGAGARRGGGVPGLPHVGQSSAPRAKTRAASPLSPHAPPAGRATNPMSPATAKSAGGAPGSNPLLRKGGSAGGGQASNPLLRKGGPTAATQRGSNPLRQTNRPAGAQSGNPLTKKGAAQPGLSGRNAGALANRNNANLGRNRGPLAQTGRGLNKGNATRNWQHASHANYRVRPYREVFHGYRPIRHDRVWYTSRYDRVVVVGGGYYYWDAGYWYPAWGYDPTVSFYVYDGPIYSYDNLPPDQVTMNVQIALQDEGYYAGEIDGLVGPQTRDALAAYQTDHNLEVTSAIDEPTVEALGLAQST